MNAITTLPLAAKEPVQGMTTITVAFGDGIGPEIMNAALSVLLAARARIAIEPIEIGERVYLAGNSSGIPALAWDSIRRTKVLYKAPITTPQGGGYKSLNVTIRKSLGLFANVRPCVAYHPFVSTRHPGMDLVIVRENEEDLYAGIEHRQTDEVFQCLKLVSRPGCEKINRFAFEYARANGRSKVSCFTKDNIMKMTDGLFHSTFDIAATDYPEIATEHQIIDIGTARIADSPEQFDVVVTSNLYGDIISDVAAQVAGSVGLAPSANIGAHGAMFEAIHGSAPDIAGQDIANPSGLLLAGVMMLVHIGQGDIAQKVHNAWLRTIEDGIHTADIFTPEVSRELVGTRAFAEAVVARLGDEPQILQAVRYDPQGRPITIPEPTVHTPAERELVGIDVFVQWRGPAETLAAALQAAAFPGPSLSMITNRGVKVWPQGMPETFCTDHWRCRFMAAREKSFNRSMIIELLRRFNAAGIDFIKTESLYTFDGEPGFSLGQGQ